MHVNLQQVDEELSKQGLLECILFSCKLIIVSYIQKQCIQIFNDNIHLVLVYQCLKTAITTALCDQIEKELIPFKYNIFMMNNVWMSQFLQRVYFKDKHLHI